jgi:DNA modification methylase
VWRLDRHRLICGDARDHDVFDRLMGAERADLVFTDPPYNVPIDGHATGFGRIRHREFAMGAGEMSVAAFTRFLQRTLGHAAALAHAELWCHPHHRRRVEIATLCLERQQLRQ